MCTAVCVLPSPGEGGRALGFTVANPLPPRAASSRPSLFLPLVAYPPLFPVTLAYAGEWRGGERLKPLPFQDLSFLQTQVSSFLGQ